MCTWWARGCYGSEVCGSQGSLNYPSYEPETQIKTVQIGEDLNICVPVQMTQSEVTDLFKPVLQREESLLLIMSGVKSFSKSLPQDI